MAGQKGYDAQVPRRLVVIDPQLIIGEPGMLRTRFGTQCQFGWFRGDLVGSVGVKTLGSIQHVAVFSRS